MPRATFAAGAGLTRKSSLNGKQGTSFAGLRPGLGRAGVTKAFSLVGSGGGLNPKTVYYMNQVGGVGRNRSRKCGGPPCSVMRYSSPTPKPSTPTPKPPSPFPSFDELDMDGNSLLDTDELENYMSPEVVDVFDADGNGSLDSNEYAKLVEEVPALDLNIDNYVSEVETMIVNKDSVSTILNSILHSMWNFIDCHIGMLVNSIDQRDVEKLLQELTSKLTALSDGDILDTVLSLKTEGDLMYTEFLRLEYAKQNYIYVRLHVPYATSESLSSILKKESACYKDNIADYIDNYENLYKKNLTYGTYYIIECDGETGPTICDTINEEAMYHPYLHAVEYDPTSTKCNTCNACNEANSIQGLENEFKHDCMMELDNHNILLYKRGAGNDSFRVVIHKCDISYDVEHTCSTHQTIYKELLSILTRVFSKDLSADITNLTEKLLSDNSDDLNLFKTTMDCKITLNLTTMAIAVTDYSTDLQCRTSNIVHPKCNPDNINFKNDNILNVESMLDKSYNSDYYVVEYSSMFNIVSMITKDIEDLVEAFISDIDNNSHFTYRIDESFHNLSPQGQLENMIAHM